MSDYLKYIAVVGSGIAGLTLACKLKQEGIPVIIFEKSSTTSEQGAGISISPNGLRVLRYLGVEEQLRNESGTPSEIKFLFNQKEITSFPIDVVTTSRQCLYKVLLDKYYSLGGEVLFNHEIKNIDSNNTEILFVNKKSYRVKHIAACDGIKSTCKSLIYKNSEQPAYSGYSVWRAILDKKQDKIETHLGPKFHIVTYPINNHRTSFVAAIKTPLHAIESWKAKGSFEELCEDLPVSTRGIYSSLKDSDEIYKWGVYTKKMPTQLFEKNITFLGDAAHPIVPFMGQGGCLALEDGYMFGKLIKCKNDIETSQKLYQKLRLNRVKKIHKDSILQGKLNHISNPFAIYCRNFLMKYSSIASFKPNLIWRYDPDIEINKIK